MDNRLKKTVCLCILFILVSACSSRSDKDISPLENTGKIEGIKEIPLSLPSLATVPQKKEEPPKKVLGFYKKESGSDAVNSAFRHSSEAQQVLLDPEKINNVTSFIDKRIEFIRYAFGLNNSIYVADFTNSLMFDYDKSSVRDDDEYLLDSFAKLYKTEAFGKYLYIIGHTDSDGNEAYNYGLSTRRARSIASILIDNDVNESKLSIVPAGEYLPRASNSTKEGKQLNRRVEVISADSRTLIQSYLRQLKCPINESCQRKILNIFDVRKAGTNTEMNIKNPHSFATYSPELNNLIQLDESLRKNPEFFNAKSLNLNDKQNLIEMGELRQDFLIEIDIRPVLRLAIQKRAGFHIPKKYIIKD